jgi:DNA-binding winged helix-turn-helix (wHTH) protein
MPESSPSPAIVRFDGYAVHLRAGELYKSDIKIKLQEQPFQILAMLLEHPGEMVTREELRQRLWSEDTFVDFDHSLNTAIKKLRGALGDEADKPRYIETLPRRGYRFIGCVAENAPVRVQPAMGAPSGSAGNLVGKELVIRDESGKTLVSLPVDEMALKEKEKLEAVADDLGLSLLFAAQQVLVVKIGTRVKVLGGPLANSCYEVRILEGEHTAKTAVVPADYLVEPDRTGNARAGG